MVTAVQTFYDFYVKSFIFSPFLFTPYASNLQRKFDSCHLQKYSDDTAKPSTGSVLQESKAREKTETLQPSHINQAALQGHPC